MTGLDIFCHRDSHLPDFRYVLRLKYVGDWVVGLLRKTVSDIPPTPPLILQVRNSALIIDAVAYEVFWFRN